MQSLQFCNFDIPNPKQYAEGIASDLKTKKIFPYYAGYSKSFATSILSSTSLPKNAVVMDPWNGAGTTTQAADELGLRALGYDLNPVMVIVAKASLLPAQERPSLLPLARSILDHAGEADVALDADPLTVWLSPSSTRFVRSIENEINRSLVQFDDYKLLHSAEAVNQISPLAAFFYVVLFRMVRRLLVDFIPSNPTWTKKPSKHSERKRPNDQTMREFFLEELLSASESCVGRDCDGRDVARAEIFMGNSENIPVDSGSVDAVVTSPPYCTRIDYAVATAIELAVLRFDNETFDGLRRSLMGTSTVLSQYEKVSDEWGRTCLSFLDNVYSHSSKASKTYYYKNHVQYFSSLRTSIAEIERSLKLGGVCVLVIQDSYYKDVFNDVPTIAAEMANNLGLTLARRADFPVGRSMVGLNAKARAYVAERRNSESVLFLRK